MITGFNTDVQHDDRVFHVQTEDKGLDNPVVESLVYTGGEIVGSRRASYADLLRGRPLSEAELQKRMENQHGAVIREIYAGRFDPDGPKPFGYKIITNRSLDEVVLDYLRCDVGLEQIRLDVEADEPPIEGEVSRLRLRVMAEGSDRPVSGARVTIKLISTKDRPKEIFAGVSDDAGVVDAEFHVPSCADANAALICQAEADGKNAEIKRIVRKPEGRTGL